METDTKNATPGSDGNMDFLINVELPTAIRFGETEMTLASVVKLGVGSVIELDSGIQEPVSLVVNGQIFARGEVVVVDGYYGIKITEICGGKQPLLGPES